MTHARRFIILKAMIARTAPRRYERLLRFAIAVFLFLAEAPRGATAQEFQIDRVDMAAPLGGSAAAARPGAPALAFSGALLGGAPSLSAPSVQPRAVAAAALSPGAVSARSAPKIIPAAAATAAAAPNQETDRQTGADSTAAPRSRSAEVTPRRAAAAPEDFPLLTAAAEGPLSAEDEHARAEKSFSTLIGERLAPARAGAVALAPAVFALGLHPGIQAAIQPSLASWHALSQAGYVAGNAGAAIFPLVQIYQTFHGKSTPKNRALVGAAASLALGLISAPILHKSLWGIQNIFGGLTLLAPLLIGRFAGRARGNGLKETALIAAASLAVAAAAYFTVVPALPNLLAAAFSAAAVAKIALAVQMATSAMFLWMFLPDVVKVLRGKTADGFSPGFNLMFFLSSAGSMLWALPSAWISAGAHQDTYRVIFAVNTIYALASFLSFRFARRETKQGPPPSQRDPS